MAIKIIVDSASDIGREEAHKLGITMIPLTILFGEDEYLDGVDLTPLQFYEKLIEGDELPKTSQISAYRFEEEFKKIVENGDEALVITLSSKLSGTNASAQQAAAQFNGKVRVIDSLNAAIGERLLVQYALRLIEAGKTLDEIERELNAAKTKIRLMAMIDTLEYLKKGGRISAMTAFAGGLLSLKPVIAVVDGEVKVIGKALGSKKGNNLLNTLVQKSGGINFDMPYGVVWSGLSDSLLEKYVKDSAHLWEAHTDNVPAYPLGGTIGTHVGPGAIGVAFFEK